MLRASLSRSRRRDPVVAGFTRTVRGRLSNYAGSGFNVEIGGRGKAPIFCYAGVLHNGACVQGSLRQWRGGAIGSQPAAFGEIRLDNAAGGDMIAQVSSSFSGATPGTAGAGVLSGFQATDVDPWTATLELFGGRARWWSRGLLNQDSPLATPAALTASISAVGDRNVLGPGLCAKFTAVDAVVMRRFDLECVSCPANGSVRVSVNGAAEFTVTLSGAGAAVVPMPPTTIYPCVVRYRIYDSDGLRRATLTIKDTWGGDVIGFVPALAGVGVVPVPAESFALPAVAGARVLDWRGGEQLGGTGDALIYPAPSAVGNALSSLAAPTPTLATIGGNGRKCARIANPATAVKFDMGGASSPFQDDFTLYLVAKITGTSVVAVSGQFFNGAPLMSGENGGTTTDWALAMFAGGGIVIGSVDQTSNGGTPAGNILNGVHILTVRRRKVDGEIQAMIDGVLACRTAAAAGASLANSHPATPYLGNVTGDVGRWLGFTAYHSDADVAAIVAALQDEYGLL